MKRGDSAVYVKQSGRKRLLFAMPIDNWFHDIFHADGTSYRRGGIAAIRWYTRDKTLDWLLCYRPRPTEPERRPGEINDTDAAVKYSDGWTGVEVDGPRGGTLHYANAAGSTVELVFTGTEIDLLYKQGPDCGIARITIDGRPATELDTYGPTVNWNAQHRLAEGLPEAEHVLRIEVTGRKHEKSSNSYVQVVGFDVR